MEPISTAIFAALAAGAVTGATDVSKKVIVDGYGALKEMIKKKFGGKTELADAIENLEKKPDSSGRQRTLQEEVAAAGVDNDPEIIKQAEALLKKIKAQPGGEQHIQTAIGNYIAQADRGGTASIIVNRPSE